jgi:hypothetical protein
MMKAYVILGIAFAIGIAYFVLVGFLPLVYGMMGAFMGVLAQGFWARTRREKDVENSVKTSGLGQSEADGRG